MEAQQLPRAREFACLTVGAPSRRLRVVTVARLVELAAPIMPPASSATRWSTFRNEKSRRPRSIRGYTASMTT